MALRSNALTSLSLLKGELNISDTYTDTLLENYIEAASDVIREHIGYSPISDTYTDEVYDGPGLVRLMLKARPILTLVDVKLNDVDVDQSDFILRDFYIDGDSYVFTAGNSNYKISYSAGYGDTIGADGFPRIFTIVANQLASLYYSRKGTTGSIGASSHSSAVGGSRSNTIISESEILEPLDRYVLPRV